MSESISLETLRTEASAPSSPSTLIPPSLPVELLSKIIAEVPRSDLPSVHAVCRTFRVISRPLLFKELVYFGFYRIETSLMSIAHDLVLADLVRVVEIHLYVVPPENPQQIDEILGIVAIALGRFLKLESFVLFQPEDGPTEVPLNKVLELAILSHPSLRTFSYDRWHSALTSHTFSFKRATRSHPLVIKEISYPYDPEDYGHVIISPLQFYRTVFRYISHHQIHVQSLELAAPQSNGHPLPLLLETPIAGLLDFTITHDWRHSLPHLFLKTTWLSLFLQSHPLLQTISITDADSLLEHDDSFELPCMAFARVQGLEWLSDETLVDWSHFGAITDLHIGFYRGEKRNVVRTLTLERGVLSIDSHSPLSTSLIQGLASVIPDVQDLRLSGAFYTPDLPQTIAAFAGFKSLAKLIFPSNFLEENDTDTCYHVAEDFLDELEEDAVDPTFGFELQPGLINGLPISVPLTPQDRDWLRDRLLTSKVYHRRRVSQFVVRYEEAWRTLFERLPSLTEVDWELWAGTFLRVTLEATRDTSLRTTSMFGPPSLLETVVCYCDDDDPEFTFFDGIDYLVNAQPLFHQQPDFLPAFTLDCFFSSSSSS